MIRKFRIDRLPITSPIYKRYTNQNRGNTPRSFFTKHLRLYLDEHNYLRESNRPDTSRISRIHEVVTGIGLRVDKRFDFHSFNSGIEIDQISKTLEKEGVAGVTLSYINDSLTLTYYYPFLKVKENSKDLYNEESKRFYPGVYYSRGKWFWSNSLNASVTDSPNSFLYSSEYSLGDTNYTEESEKIVLIDELYNSYYRYFIFIPYSVIKTPILEAYLPLSRNFNYFDPIVNYNIEWLGRQFPLFTVEEIRSGIYRGTYTANNTALNSLPVSSVVSYIQNLLITELRETDPFANIVSSKYNVGQYPDFRGLELFTTIGNIFRVYRSSNTGSLEPVTSFYRDCIGMFNSSIERLSQAALYLTFTVETGSNGLVRLITLVFDISYTPSSSTEVSYEVTKERYISESLLKVIYYNCVPVKTGFHHLNQPEVLPN